MLHSRKDLWVLKILSELYVLRVIRGQIFLKMQQPTLNGTRSLFNAIRLFPKITVLFVQLVSNLDKNKIHIITTESMHLTSYTDLYRGDTICSLP